MKIQCTKMEWRKLQLFFISSKDVADSTIYRGRTAHCQIEFYDSDFLEIDVTFEDFDEIYHTG